MNGLERTYQFLESTPNQAAVHVLLPALKATQREVRGRAIAALLHRESVEGCRQLIDRWDDFEIEDRLQILGGGPTLLEAVRQILDEQDEKGLLRAIEIAQTLSFIQLAPRLISLAESDASYAVRRRALKVVLQLADEQGSAARSDREQAANRGPLVRTLAKSVARFPIHRNLGLVDAMLAASKGSDSELNTMLAPKSETQGVLLDRFRTSKTPGVLQLLANMIHRRRLPLALEKIIVTRTDSEFRDTLLDAFGCNPAVTPRKNLATIGIPACCDVEHLAPEALPPRRRCALALLYAAADSDPMRSLNLLLDALDGADQASRMGLMHALCRFPPFESERLLRAAASFRMQSPNDLSLDPDVALLQRMLSLLEGSDSAFFAPLRAMLEPLKIKEVMPFFESIRPSTRKRLGQVILIVDPDAVSTIADQLRHPVLQRRVDAMRASVALNAIDALAQPLIRCALNDHLEARVHAIRALADGRCEAAQDALTGLAMGPEGPIRDAAIEALQTRASRK